MKPNLDDSQASERTSRWIDMAAIMAVNNLHWRAKTVVNGFNKGIHRSLRHGFSVEFSEYRPFTYGDDPRTVDWKLFARSDRLYLKKFEDETNRRCYLVVDQSVSMKYTSGSYSKLDFANTLAATLAYYWLKQRDAVGVISFDQSLGDVIPAKYRPGQLKRILSALERVSSGSNTDLLSPLEQIANWNQRKSSIIIISDFLVSPATAKESLAKLKGRKHDIVLVQTLDPHEIEWRLESSAMIRDIETGNEIFVDPTTATAVYQERFQSHQNQWRTMAESLGIKWFSLATSTPMDQVLLSLVKT